MLNHVKMCEGGNDGNDVSYRSTGPLRENSFTVDL